MSDQENHDALKLISAIYRKTQMYLNDAMRDMGLSSGLATFILITCENGVISQSRFCELLDMDKSTVAKTLGKLMRMGYVERRQSASDSRSFDILPTRQAREVYPRLIEIGSDWAMEMTRGMTDIERKIFFEMLRKVSHNSSGYFCDDENQSSVF